MYDERRFSASAVKRYDTILLEGHRRVVTIRDPEELEQYEKRIKIILRILLLHALVRGL